MAEAFFDSGVELFRLAITILICIGILINIATRRGADQIYFIISLVGYFYLLLVMDDFFLATIFIAAWFIVMGSEFIVPKYILIALLAVIGFLGYANPFFFIGTIAVYVITITSFISNSFRRVKGGSGKPGV